MHSVTAQTDRIDPFDLEPRANAAPRWHRLTSGHSYAWHEHRLHVLEPAHGGSWSVPLVVDGTRHELRGVLDYHRPGRTWAWLALAGCIALIGAAAALGRGRAAIWFALAATPLVWSVRVARELYGRPSVGIVGYVEVAATSIVGAALLAGLFHRNEEVRIFTAMLTGIGAIYQGLTMVRVLTHAIALTLLPTAAAKALVACCLGLGVATVVGGMREQLR